jgi:hypothetical protein
MGPCQQGQALGGCDPLPCMSGHSVQHAILWLSNIPTPLQVLNGWQRGLVMKGGWGHRNVTTIRRSVGGEEHSIEDGVLVGTGAAAD